MRWLRRFSYWVRFRANEHDLRDEIALHRDLLGQDLERRGLPLSEVEEVAARAMGNETYMREEARAVWLPPGLELVLQDARYAWRGLRRSPAFTIVAALSLALGIGANTAIFGLIHAVLLARLPVRAPEDLVEVMRDLGAKGQDERFSRAEFEALAAGPAPLAMFANTFSSLDVNGAVANGNVEAVSGGYFDLLGVRAQRGRLLSPTDNQSGAPVAVVTEKFWRGRLNADSAVIGRVIKVNGQPFTTVGVLPTGFAGLRFPAIDDVLIPYRSATSLGVIRERSPQQPMLTVFARSASVASTRQALGALWGRCCAAGALVVGAVGQTVAPSRLEMRDVSRGITSAKLDLRGHYARILFALMAAVVVLLLAACANVANLLVARSSTRLGELAVRRAMGASAARLVTQLVIESLQLSLLGALLGAGLAQLGMMLLTRTNVGDLSGVIQPRLAPPVLVFTTVISMASGLIFGIVPAARVMRSDLNTPLRQSGRRSARGRGILDRGLVGVQVALALLLVSGATLLVETLRNLQDARLGFDPAERLALTVETRRTSYERTGMTAQMASEMLRHVRALPGVQSAAFGSEVPIYGGRSSVDNVSVPGGVPLTDGNPETEFAGVTPGYFAALGTPLLAGRDVGAPVPTQASEREVVVNDLFVKKFLPGREPVGQVFQDQDEGDPHVTTNRVVGVVASAKFRNARAPAEAMYFVQVADGDWPYLIMVVHVIGDARTLQPALRRAVSSVAPGIGEVAVTSLSSSVDDALARERIAAVLAALFGAGALGLVAVGLYGVMLYQVAERTMEIGIRMALGAKASSVVALVLRQSLTVLAVGLLAGVPLALAAGRAVASQLYGVAPYSVAGLSVAVASLVFVAAIATLVPVRRAVSVDPLEALRAE